MTNKKSTILNTKFRSATRQLLVMVAFTLFFVLLSQVSARLENRNLSSIPNSAGMKTIFHEADVEDINVLLDNGWYFFPNMTVSEYESHNYSYIELMELPHADNVSISREFGWNDLGKEASWKNNNEVSFTPIRDTHTISAMYAARIQLVPNTDTIYLHLDEINGTGYVYCNGHLVGNVGSSSYIQFDITHGSDSYPIQANRAAIIDLNIIIESDSRILCPGLSISPTLTSNNDENRYLVANSIWFAYQVIIFFTCLVGCFILSKTFENKSKFIVALLLEVLYLFYNAFDNNFICVQPFQKAIITQILIVFIIILSYYFISYLFYDKEKIAKYPILKYEYVAVLALGILALAIEYFFTDLSSTLYPTIAILTLMSIAVIASVLKIIFLYINDKNAEIALIFISAYMHVVIYMTNKSITLYGIKVYTLFFVVLFFIILINYTRSYVKQYNELSNQSTRLQYMLKEKTQHISEINKDLYNTNKRLLENEEARKNVLSNVSHDLRTPITAIRGYAELLLSAGKNMKDEQVQNYLNNIIRRSSQMERIVSDIVELTRMESNTNEFQFMDVSMSELLDELYMMYEGDTRGTSKHLHIDLPETDLLMVKADPKKISRVFENLISNAINYTYDEASIKIKAWREGTNEPIDKQTVHVSISDNGIGIPQEEIDKVFDRFYRAKNSGKNIKGTGLGLSIVKTIIDRHDASIFVTSTLGSGTEFHIVMKATY